MLNLYRYRHREIRTAERLSTKERAIRVLTGSYSEQLESRRQLWDFYGQRISAKWIFPVVEGRKIHFPSLGSVKRVLSSHRSCRTDLRASGIRVGAIKIGRRGIPDGAR